MAVVLYVSLGRFSRMMDGVLMVSVCKVSVVRGLFVIARAMMLRGLMVMASGVFVMLSRFFMMVDQVL